MKEDRCLQTLHGGRYDDETPNLGVTFNGAHHEIDLSDPRRTEPARPKTVLRQPVRPI